jgi:hypothetical protein
VIKQIIKIDDNLLFFNKMIDQSFFKKSTVSYIYERMEYKVYI